MTAYDLLGNALIEIMDLRNSFEMVVKEATQICPKWGITDDKTLTKKFER